MMTEAVRNKSFDINKGASPLMPDDPAKELRTILMVS